MPTIVGTALADASGTALQDASAELLGEPDLEVYLAPNRILYAGNQPQGPGWLDLVDLFANAVMVSQIKADMDIITPRIQTLYTLFYQQLGDELQALALNEADINSMADEAADRHQAVLDAIAAIEAGGLTTEEHDQLLGLLNVDYDDVSNAVWHQLGSVGPIDGGTPYSQRGEMVDSLFAGLAFQAGYQGLRLPWSQYFRVVAPDPLAYVAFYQQYQQIDDGEWPPEPDFAEWVDGDSPYTFLARTQPTFGWDNIGPTGLGHDEVAWRVMGGAHGSLWVRSDFAAADVPKVVAAEVGQEVVIPPMVPIWPGSAGVTLGDPVALVDQLNLVGTFDGVLVNVTTPPTKTGLRSIGGALYDYNVGEIAFETDGGEIEPWQYMGFRSAIFTPKTMTSAAGARFRVLAGAAGTVTPWTRS